MRTAASSHVRNPLTVIAIFAAIAEVSGTLVLPQIADANQELFIYFLIAFPFTLVLLFFLTLNFNHTVLYAPSDWQNEENFLRAFGIATEEQKNIKLQEEVAVAEAALAVSPPLPVAGARPRSSTSREITMERYRRVERAAVNKLSTVLNLQFSPGAAYRVEKDRFVLFDAIAIEANRVNVMEVKLVNNTRAALRAISRQMVDWSTVARNIASEGSQFVVHFVLVLANGNDDPEIVKNALEAEARHFPLQTICYVFEEQDLV